MDDTTHISVTNIIPFANLRYNAEALEKAAFALATNKRLTAQERHDLVEALDRDLTDLRICVRLVREQLGPEVGALSSDKVGEPA